MTAPQLHLFGADNTGPACGELSTEDGCSSHPAPGVVWVTCIPCLGFVREAKNAAAAALRAKEAADAKADEEFQALLDEFDPDPEPDDYCCECCS